MTEIEKFFSKLKYCPDNFPCPSAISFVNPSLRVGFIVSIKGEPIKKVKDHLFQSIVQCGVLLSVSLDIEKLKDEIYTGPF